MNFTDPYGRDACDDPKDPNYVGPCLEPVEVVAWQSLTFGSPYSSFGTTFVMYSGEAYGGGGVGGGGYVVGSAPAQLLQPEQPVQKCSGGALVQNMRSGASWGGKIGVAYGVIEGAAVGGAGGLVVGGATGGVFGSAAGPVGTVAGAVAGATGGGMTGALIGGFLGGIVGGMVGTSLGVLEGVVITGIDCMMGA